MTKNLFKWMMAIAIVASPMVFTACGDDDESGKSSSGSGTQTDDDKDAIYFSLSSSQSTSNVTDMKTFNQNVAIVESAFYTTMASVLGYTFDGNTNVFKGEYSDTTKVRIACDALYAEMKDKIDLVGGLLSVHLNVGPWDINKKTSFASYKFGSSASRYTLGFENATLNSDKYWIGDSINGTFMQGAYGPVWACTYTEDLATVNMTYGGSYWNGFAISARTDTVFKDNYMGPDQYNNIVGKGYAGSNNFLVVQGTWGTENITFSKPVDISGFHYTNSAVVVNSILNGDSYSGDKFGQDDWLKCTVTATLADSARSQVTYDIDLAKDGNYVKTWKATEGLSNTFVNVVALSFSFSGSRTGDWGLNTPAYMCIDNLVYRAK